MKRLLSIFLSFIILSTCSVFIVGAEETTSTITSIEPAEEIFPLSQLGVLDVTEPESIVTKGTLANALDIVMGEGTSFKYFEGQDLEMPLTYGQAVMILIDAMGYVPYMYMYDYDASSPSGYLRLAKRIDLIGSETVVVDEQLTVNEYAKLLYKALIEIPYLNVSGLDGGNFVYSTNKEATLLTLFMNLTKVSGKVSGVDGVSTDTRDNKRKNSIKIADKWYEHNIDTDLFGLFGRFCEAYVNESNQLMCIFEVKRENEVTQISTDDINPNTTSLKRVSYYNENGRQKSISISGEFDLIYNRELLTDPRKSDLTVSNADMTLIDNDNDNRADVVIIEKFKSYVVFAVSIVSNRIVDTYGNTYDLNEYFEDDYVLYGVYGKAVDLNTPVRYNVISYLESKSGNTTYMKLCDEQAVGIFDSSKENLRYVTIDGKEYECCQDYLSNLTQRDEIKLGDRVTAYLDINGRIVDIKYVAGTEKAAYLMGTAPKIFGEYQVKILDSDGEIKILSVPVSIIFDGAKKKTSVAFDNAIFKKSGGEFKPQLILYKTNSKGELVSIDTAQEINKNGSRNNDGFTLDYDYEVNGTPRALIMNGELIVASKYLATMETTTVFGVVTNSEEDCYVQSGNAFNSGAALPVSTDLKVKIYNVNQNYEAQYIVYEQEITEGGWVDYWGDPYILDEVTTVLNGDKEIVYALKVYNPKGRYYIKYAENPELKTQEYNTISGDSRIYDVALKDLPKGTVLFINEDFGGVRSISVQHMPMADKSELIYEKITSASSSDGNYGINERTYNGKYLMSYGQVVARIEAGIVVNNHLPTEEELAEGAVYPMEEWNRVIPLMSSDVVFLYHRNSNVLTIESADCILPGDMVFVKRSGATYNGVYVYRD